jgi:hypothetical protein
MPKKSASKNRSWPFIVLMVLGLFYLFTRVPLQKPGSELIFYSQFLTYLLTFPSFLDPV